MRTDIELWAHAWNFRSSCEDGGGGGGGKGGTDTSLQASPTLSSCGSMRSSRYEMVTSSPTAMSFTARRRHPQLLVGWSSIIRPAVRLLWPRALPAALFAAEPRGRRAPHVGAVGHAGVICHRRKGEQPLA